MADGYITGSLMAAASVQPPNATDTVLLNWYACDQNGDKSATPLPIGVGGTFPIPTTLSAGTHYFICHGSYPSAVGINSTVAKVTVLALPVWLNSITGIAAGQSYQQGDTVTFTAHGGGMELPSPYALNATRWKPDHWEANPSGDFNNVYTQCFSTAGMTPGAHTLTAVFVLERYDGANWAELSPRVTDQVSVPFAIKGDGSGTSAPPKTGDVSHIIPWAMLCLLAAAGLLVLTAGKKRRV